MHDGSMGGWGGEARAVQDRTPGRTLSLLPILCVFVNSVNCSVFAARKAGVFRHSGDTSSNVSMLLMNFN